MPFILVNILKQNGCVIFVLFLLFFILAYYILKLIFSIETVYEYERGVKFKRGKFEKVLLPGTYLFIRYGLMIKKIDIRPSLLTIPGQEILSLDGVPLKISLISQVKVENPKDAVLEITDYYSAIYLILQTALREVVSTMNIDEALGSKNEINKKIIEGSKESLEKIGISTIKIMIKDIMLSGELKRKFSDIIIAKKENIAKLERARGETAVLRSLANTAKMMEKNPNLTNLRFMQTLDESKGNTYVFGINPLNIPIHEDIKKPKD